MEQIDKLPFILTKELEHDIKKSLTKYMHTRVYLYLSKEFITNGGSVFRMLKKEIRKNEESI